AALFDVGGEMDDAVTERTNRDFFRVQRADKRDIDVTTTFEAFRHTDVLNAAGGIGLEPRVTIDLVALDSNQPAARIRSGDADRDVVAAVVLRAIKFYFQLRVFL